MIQRLELQLRTLKCQRSPPRPGARKGLRQGHKDHEAQSWQQPGALRHLLCPSGACCSVPAGRPPGAVAPPSALLASGASFPEGLAFLLALHKAPSHAAPVPSACVPPSPQLLCQRRLPLRSDHVAALGMDQVGLIQTGCVHGPPSPRGKQQGQSRPPAPSTRLSRGWLHPWTLC